MGRPGESSRSEALPALLAPYADVTLAPTGNGLEGSRLLSIADVTGPESLVEVRTFEQEQKVAANNRQPD